MADSGNFTRIPNSLIDNGDYTAHEKIVLMVLFRFSFNGAKCWPSIRTIAERAGISTSTTRRTIQKLSDNGILAISKRYREGTGEHESNAYKINSQMLGTVSVKVPTVTETPQVLSDRHQGTVTVTPEEEQENKNKMNKAADAAIRYLNEKAGRNFRCTKNNRKHITARLSEGFTSADLETVIDDKVRAWGPDNKMSEYLRPSTLFGSKFESYLQAANRQKRPAAQTTAFNKCPACGALTHPEDRVCSSCNAELKQREDMSHVF